MKRLVALGLVCSALVLTLLTAPAQAAPGAATSVAAASSTDAAKRLFMKSRFARLSTERGDRDASPTRIEHVYELQYRLRWEGVYKGPISGYFGSKTKRAVKRFQRRADIKVTGRATRVTWNKLIRTTIRGRKAIPKMCKRSGWRACYDRKRHQVTLWHDGKIHNSWLVRGGASSYKTRTGTFSVFRRSRYHVSSIYESKMPYAQFFSGGQAFHASYYMVNPFAGHSHGCINMYISDARQLWRLTADKQLRVSVYGAWD